MGTINYGNNDFFNIGMDMIEEWDDYDKETEQAFLWDEITEELKRYDFNAFSVTLKPGYYEGVTA